ncbi:oxidoreductase [Actinoplanes sp. N902-109]|nr:SDR family NAD(P)-dependent oxidoreductase [Actinoplanes sp. N902-109]AGL16394.1 oxidoreductase [Actinoplanes sp. N902-109]
MPSYLVTGASAGLGLVTATELAAQQRHVVLAVRDPDRGRAAIARIRQSVPDASCELLVCDLASLASVRRAVAELLQGDRPPWEGVIANAGLQVVRGVETSADGYELTFAINHLGHFLLITQLLPHLPRGSRVISVASEVHQGPAKSMGFPAPQWRDPRELADPALPGLDTSSRGGRVRYANSKLANIMFTYELARRAADRGVTALAFDPGLMPETGLDRQYPALMQRGYSLLAPLVVALAPGARSVAQSGADLAWLATSPELAGVTGRYYSGRTPRSSSALSRQESEWARLWERSEELVAAAGRK